MDNKKIYLRTDLRDVCHTASSNPLRAHSSKPQKFGQTSLSPVQIPLLDACSGLTARFGELTQVSILTDEPSLCAIHESESIRIH